MSSHERIYCQNIPNHHSLLLRNDTMYHRCVKRWTQKSKCLKFSTFIVFFDFLSTILAPYLCRHIHFYCLYNSTVWYFQIWLKLAFSRSWHVQYLQCRWESRNLPVGDQGSSHVIGSGLLTLVHLIWLLGHLIEGPILLQNWNIQKC